MYTDLKQMSPRKTRYRTNWQVAEDRRGAYLTSWWTERILTHAFQQHILSHTHQKEKLLLISTHAKITHIYIQTTYVLCIQLHQFSSCHTKQRSQWQQRCVLLPSSPHGPSSRCTACHRQAFMQPLHRHSDFSYSLGRITISPTSVFQI